MNFGTNGCMYNCGDSCTGECIEPTNNEQYIGLILDERNEHYTIGYRETSDLEKLKEWKKERLACSNVIDCKILKIEESYE